MFQLKGLKAKNKGHTNFYECCDLTKKYYILKVTYSCSSYGFGYHIKNLHVIFSSSRCFEKGQLRKHMQSHEVHEGSQSEEGKLRIRRRDRTIFRKVRVRAEQKCDLCGKNFDDSETLRDHKLYVHENIKAHQCSTCPMTFGYLESLRKHERHEHGNFIGKKKFTSYKKIPNSEYYYCDFCDHKTKLQGNLQRHIESGEYIIYFLNNVVIWSDSSK